MKKNLNNFFASYFGIPSEELWEDVLDDTLLRENRFELMVEKLNLPSTDRLKLKKLFFKFYKNVFEKKRDK